MSVVASFDKADRSGDPRGRSDDKERHSIDQNRAFQQRRGQLLVSDAKIGSAESQIGLHVARFL
jgi:hypothetical protein